MLPIHHHRVLGEIFDANMQQVACVVVVFRGCWRLSNCHHLSFVTLTHLYILKLGSTLVTLGTSSTLTRIHFCDWNYPLWNHHSTLCDVTCFEYPNDYDHLTSTITACMQCPSKHLSKKTPMKNHVLRCPKKPFLAVQAGKQTCDLPCQKHVDQRCRLSFDLVPSPRTPKGQRSLK